MSLTSSHIKNIRALQQKKNRKERGLFVIEGVKNVQELINSNIEIHSVFSTENIDFLDKLNPTDVHIIKQKELERISGLRSANKLLAIAKIPKVKPIDWNDPLILMLDGINDPGNLGTIIRTAKWFGINTIFCSENCADAYDRKVVQSTMGALFHINLVYGNLFEMQTKCADRNFSIIGAAMVGESIYSYTKTAKTALIIGSESHGISKEVLETCNAKITIPNNEISQKVESLNAGVATSIILSELTKPK